MRKYYCIDCGAVEGEYHAVGCEQERCPFCGGQLISCGCYFRVLNIQEPKIPPGLSKEETLTFLRDQLEESIKNPDWKHERDWWKLVKEKGRIPYIQQFNICARCGELNPELFKEPDEKWEKYVIPALQREILCRDCYEEMKSIFPHGWIHARRYRNHNSKFV